MIQPTPTERQSITTLISDLEVFLRRLSTAIEWTKNVAQAVEKCRALGQIEFSALGRIIPTTTSTGILLRLPSNGVIQDIHVTTLVCKTKDLIGGKLAPSPEAIRISQALQWQEALGSRVFETHFVDGESIWRGSDSATESFLTAEVRKWLAYWFPSPPKAVFRSVKTMEIIDITKKSLT